ncbi:hypothetical protein BRCON_0342 [Candidatus Sumerlaea chitinivorans]|uniref:Uncharacterized protein n=1 Tax=Sumerlaea chitinivorans TaxID=2250252 RepID=A0A2Z4Y2C7_SUMC1|nr:hypothetical protein BRCON_0342 [Candidatus Sumerlaea chitinivorans]
MVGLTMAQRESVSRICEKEQPDESREIADVSCFTALGGKRLGAMSGECFAGSRAMAKL